MDQGGHSAWQGRQQSVRMLMSGLLIPASYSCGHREARGMAQVALFLFLLPCSASAGPQAIRNCCWLGGDPPLGCAKVPVSQQVGSWNRFKYTASTMPRTRRSSDLGIFAYLEWDILEMEPKSIDKMYFYFRHSFYTHSKGNFMWYFSVPADLSRGQL